MARNPYSVLGVAPSASDSDIRAAFRTLAKQFHPDRNQGDKKAEDKFKEVSSAFDILGDADRRRRFDRGELDNDGRERAGAHGFGGGPGQGPSYREWRSGAGAQSDPFGGGFGGNQGEGARGASGDFADLSDIFADLFGARGGPRGTGGGSAGGRGFQTGAPRGRDLRYRLEVEFLDAARGAKKRVTMPDGRQLSVTIPAGLENGQTLRLKGQGEAVGGGVSGDVYVEVAVKSHAIFEREGDDIHLEAPVTLREAVLGGRITVPTIAGDVAVTVPRSASSGTVLRLRGRGITRSGKSGGKSAKPDGQTGGDQFVKLKIVLPEGGDAALEEFVRHWSGGDADAARKHFESV